MQNCLLEMTCFVCLLKNIWILDHWINIYKKRSLLCIDVCDMSHLWQIVLYIPK
jgi:hypothetical protein